MREKNKKDS